MSRKIIVFDFETSAVEPESDLCDPVELAAVAIDTKTMQIVSGSEFSVFIRPDTIDDANYYDLHKSTIDWHCTTKNINKDDLIKKWKGGTKEKVAWESFIEYVG